MRARSFEAAAIAEPRRLFSTMAGREPQTLLGARVSEQFFKVLGITMLHGRAFLPQEHRRGAGRVAILSHDVWRDRFGGDQSTAGQAVRLDDEALCGVMSFTTSQRTREFGVRTALGAGRRDIVELVVGEGLKLTGVGVIAGIVVALALTRLLRALLFGVTATDPVTFLFVSMALVLIAAGACCVPASRALEVDPVEALRVD